MSLVTRGGRLLAISTRRWRSPSGPPPLSYVDACCVPVVVPVVSVVVVSPRSMIFALAFADERYGSPLLVISSCVEAEYVG